MSAGWTSCSTRCCRARPTARPSSTATLASTTRTSGWSSPTPTSCHALNTLGTFGEVHVASNGTEKFGSANLNDNGTSCPPGAGNPACNPLPAKIKLVDNLKADQHSVFSFGFKPSEKFKAVQNAQLLGLDYKLVATQHGIDPS